MNIPADTRAVSGEVRHLPLPVRPQRTAFPVPGYGRDDTPVKVPAPSRRLRRKNRAAVDDKAQKSWLEGRGVDTGSMSETAILSANTGSQVFLTAQVWFADAMEDLCFTITM